MGPIQATIHCLTHPFTWDARATRSEFWWYALTSFIGGIAFVVFVIYAGLQGAFSSTLAAAAQAEASGISPQEAEALVIEAFIDEHFAFVIGFSIASVYLAFVGLSVTIRRLHDAGRSGWWYLIQLVPFIGGFWLLFLMFLPSDEKNEWGPPSAYTPEQQAKFEARRARNLEAYMQPRSEIDVHDTPDAVRALRHSRMPTA